MKPATRISLAAIDVSLLFLGCTSGDTSCRDLRPSLAFSRAIVPSLSMALKQDPDRSSVQAAPRPGGAQPICGASAVSSGGAPISAGIVNGTAACQTYASFCSPILSHFTRPMTRPVATHAVRILLSLYVFEFSILLILAGLYKAPVYDWALPFTKAGAVLIAGGIGAIASGWLLARQTRASGPVGGRAFALGLTTNLISGLLAFLLVETTVQMLGEKKPEGLVIGSVAVRPTWPELIRRSREVLAAVAPWRNWSASYFVYDRELGWNVGPNRGSRDGLYFSSLEGIRSARPNVRMADENPRFRIALIGDSHAFSFEVPFEDSWGSHLQRLLGGDAQVLNFGVDGYGIDQAYLRYRRDVRPWKPKVVVIGFAGHDLWRALAVYPFVSFGWPGYLVKPRFAVEKEALKLLNAPLPTPAEILGAGRIQQLPFIEYDLGYETTDWHWRWEHSPLILRFLTSAFPRWPIADPRVSPEAATVLNSHLFRQLVESIEESGSVPLLVLMTGGNALVPEALARARIPYLDMAECVSGIPAKRLKVQPNDTHYTGLANEAIARCTAPAVALALRKSADGAHRGFARDPRQGSKSGSPSGSRSPTSWAHRPLEIMGNGPPPGSRHSPP